MHWNAEGVQKKLTELEHILSEKNVSVCCIQETHLKPDKTFKVRGYKCYRSDRTERRKGGVLTLVRNNITATLLHTHMEDSEHQTITIRNRSMNFDVVNFYGPDTKPLALDSIKPQKANYIVVGDFNSHSQSWGYDHLNNRGAEVELWQDAKGLILLNKPFDQDTFYHRGWLKTTTPDLAFATPELGKNAVREVGEQLGGSDHRPVFVTLGIEAKKKIILDS